MHLILFKITYLMRNILRQMFLQIQILLKAIDELIIVLHSAVNNNLKASLLELIEYNA